MKPNKDQWFQSKHGFRYFKFSKSALLLEWPPDKSKKTLDQIQNVMSQISKSKLKGIIDLVPAYHSLTVIFKSSYINHLSLMKEIEQFEFGNYNYLKTEETVIIPVSYGSQDAEDLSFVASTLGISEGEVIALHTNASYIVHFIGFLPGFLYLGGLDERLNIPRRETPRIRVPAGSVALAGGQTGIYPIDSPGGWHIIGKTNISLFSPTDSVPCPFQSGTRIKFESI